VIGGVPPGPGYWRRDGDERERFVVPPTGPCQGQRVFRTGDLGRLTASDDLHYCGRADRQIKIRGARVEPGEIERVMMQHATVSSAAVAHVGDETGGEDSVGGDGGGRLVAFAQLRDAGGPEAIDAVRAHLVATLPRYMVPTTIVAVPRLPKLASGKVDYAALAAAWTTDTAPGTASLGTASLGTASPGTASLATASPGTAAAAAAPMTTTEARVAAAMSQLLDRPIASPEADFFQSGGHSLSAASLIGRLARDTVVVITLGELFERPTVAAIASVLDRKQHAPAAARGTFEAIAPAVRPRRHDA
jgi:nonribosomal peptide synthetase DhbF